MTSMSDIAANVDDTAPDAMSPTMAEPSAENPPLAEAPEKLGPCGTIPPTLRDALDGALADLREAEAEDDAAREQAKATKKEREACHERLKRVSQQIADALAGRHQPELFGGDGSANPAALDAPEPPEPAADLTAEEKARPIADLGLTDALNALLDAANITTVGELHARMKGKGEFWNADIKGLGGERADKVLDAFYGFVGWQVEG